MNELGSAAVVPLGQLLADTSSWALFPEHRGFAWEKRHVDALATKLLSYPNPPSATPVYLGAITFAETTGARILLDGLQRITVVTLALGLVRQRIRGRAAVASERLNRYLFRLDFGAPPAPKLKLPNGDGSRLERVLLEGPASLRSERGKFAGAARRINALLDDQLERAGERASRSTERLDSLVATVLEGTLVAPIKLRGEWDLSTIYRDHHRCGAPLHVRTPRAHNRTEPVAVIPFDDSADDQWDLEVRMDGALRELPPEMTYANTVWIPRILWALEWAHRHRLGSQSAADIARILQSHTYLAVPNTNIARAFRHHRDDPECRHMWRELEGQRYLIRPHGRRVLSALLAALDGDQAGLG